MTSQPHPLEPHPLEPHTFEPKTPEQRTPEPRETSGSTITLLLRYVREQGGDRAVADVLARANVTQSCAELEDTANWVSYDTRIRLFDAATTVLEDPRTMFEVGATAASHGLHPAVAPLLIAFGSPREVYRQLPRMVPKFTTTSTMDLVECGATEATIRYSLHAGYVHSRLDCEYAQGLFSAIPRMFGLAPARVEHDECEFDGYPACHYHVTWSARRRWWTRQRQRNAAAEVNLATLRRQVEEFQLAAVDLVSSDDVEEVLDRIVGRAATAVLAPSYVLAVDSFDGSPPLVRSLGLSQEHAFELADRLFRGDDLGGSAVVVDIASTRRVHGRLAALYSKGYRPMDGDSSLLEAYARHAAAALDLLSALRDSQREASRAADLLGLAHELASADGAAAVAQVVAGAVPRIVGCDASAVLMWDVGRGVLQAIAASGFEGTQREVFLGAQIRPEQTPELIGVLTNHRPIMIGVSSASADLASLLMAIGAPSVIAVPLLAGDTLMGIAAVAWRTEVGTNVQLEALTRIEGVSDQAAIALQNARLLSTVRHQALYDALTGLPNRVLFAQRLDAALHLNTNASTTTGTAVLFCDLDNFKRVNDDFGHGAGDELLRQAATRLSAIVRPGDTIGRLGGDEFAVVVIAVASESAATDLAHRIVESLSVPFHIAGQDLRMTTSVGIALHAGPDGSGERLLAAADTAMYAAKRKGRNQVGLASDPTHTQPGPSLQSELAVALDQHELRLHFQPVVEISRAGIHRVVGAEALLRWEHPRLGLLSPAAFLPLAEQTSLVTDFDLWAIAAACAALARWSRIDERAPRIAVNLASSTLVDPRLLPTVRAALNRNGLDPKQVTLEVVESRSLVDLPGVVERLTELRQLGVKISLDDFGTGYSTLAWLNLLPVDQIKIDRLFITNLPCAADVALVDGILALARALGVEVVAEGVETHDQLDALRGAGCRFVQGYLLGRPAPTFDSTVAWQPTIDRPPDAGSTSRIAEDTPEPHPSRAGR